MNSLIKDKQTIFNEVVAHALSQMDTFGDKAKAMVPEPPEDVCSIDDGPSNGCYYRHPFMDGRKCFFGCLISDNEYDESMEAMSIRGIFKDFPDNMERCELLARNVSFFEGLQRIHDNYEPSAWTNVLKTFAKQNKLDLPDSIK